jgi:cell division protein FtsL
VTVAVAVSLVAVFGVVAFNAFLVQSQFRLERLESELNTQRKEFEQLRLETARLSSPERILSISRAELGMVDPEIVTHLTAPALGTPSGASLGGGPGAEAWAQIKPFLAAEP